METFLLEIHREDIPWNLVSNNLNHFNNVSYEKVILEILIVSRKISMVTILGLYCSLAYLTYPIILFSKPIYMEDIYSSLDQYTI